MLLPPAKTGTSGAVALQPGVATWVRYFEPKTDNLVRLEGENVIEYPKSKEFVQVTIRATRIRSDEKTGPTDHQCAGICSNDDALTSRKTIVAQLRTNHGDGCFRHPPLSFSERAPLLRDSFNFPVHAVSI